MRDVLRTQFLPASLPTRQRLLCLVGFSSVAEFAAIGFAASADQPQLYRPHQSVVAGPQPVPGEPKTKCAHVGLLFYDRLDEFTLGTF